MSHRRPTMACTVFIFCCKPFMWCRPDARLRHYYSCSFLSRSHSDPRLAPSILFLFIFTHLCASWFFVYFVTDVVIIIISEHDCRLYVRLWHVLPFTFQYKPFMWCRPDARLRHVNLFLPFRGVSSDTRSVFSYSFGISGGPPPDFLFI